MSECGNTIVVMHYYHILESNRDMKGTWGTETSKYPEEEKSNEIPKVVASEIARAQTNSRNGIGVRTPIWET